MTNKIIFIYFGALKLIKQTITMERTSGIFVVVLPECGENTGEILANLKIYVVNVKNF